MAWLTMAASLPENADPVFRPREETEERPQRLTRHYSMLRGVVEDFVRAVVQEYLPVLPAQVLERVHGQSLAERVVQAQEDDVAVFQLVVVLAAVQAVH
ncbi:MAG: hypothetical protein K2J50_08085, partial [Treponemataceae bacterium]|nr:hypothetical protein [Treponemataceae bacterium]